MYSRRIIDRNRSKLESVLGFELVEFPMPVRLELADHLKSSWSVKDKEIPQPNRDFSPEESAFMRNEQLMCAINMQYWAEMAANIEWDAAYGDGTGIGPIKFNDPQLLALEQIGKREELCYEQLETGQSVFGIKICCNKIRQVGFTGLFRVLLAHRSCFAANYRVLSASVDPDKVGELYTRDRLIYDNLPPYLHPGLTSFNVNEKMGLGNGSRYIYQESTQKSGVGYGRQFDGVHLTEVSQWRSADYDIELNIHPAIPSAITTLAGYEAVPLGRGGWWHNFSENVRRGDVLDWIYCYIPWYALGERKYALTPPASWSPDEETLAHARKVEETSPLYVNRRVSPSKSQLYWWEATHKQHRQSGTLAYFLTNYSATPEESFQHLVDSAFPAELIEYLSNRASYENCIPYEFSI